MRSGKGGHRRLVRFGTGLGRTLASFASHTLPCVLAKKRITNIPFIQRLFPRNNNSTIRELLELD